MVGTGQPPAGQRCAVIGHPVAHSLSPALHRAAYRSLGFDWSYDAVDVEPGGVDAFVAGLDRRVWRGLSVTMPHKIELAAYGLRLGVADAVVRLTGVANTLTLGVTPEGDRVYNTDVSGFILAMKRHQVSELASMRILGNGATATSALVAGHRLGARRVDIVVRNRARARDIVALADELSMVHTVTLLGDPLGEDVDVTFSTLPASAAAVAADQVVAHTGVVFDAIYDPWPTPLADAGHRAGRMVLNGLDLLAAQAVDQVRLMSGGVVTFELLRSAGTEALSARS